MRRSWCLSLVVGCLGLLALPVTASAAAPANDNYASPTAITGINTELTGQTNTEATLETGEQTFGIGGASVWYTWTAPASETVQIHTCHGPALDTIIGVYTQSGGSPPASGLSLVGANDEACVNNVHNSDVEFNAVMGTTYHIQVMGYIVSGTPAQGAFTIRVSDQLPTVTIDSGPGQTTSPRPSWTFHSDMPPTQFDCFFYDEPSDAYIGDELCSSPYTVPVDFPPGGYEFDALGETATGELGVDFRRFAVQSPPGTTPPATIPPATALTGLRTRALKQCRKKRSARARRNCRKRAKALPLEHFGGPSPTG